MPSGAWCATRSARTRTARVRSPAIRTRRARERTRTSFASPLDARTAVFSPRATLTPTLSPVLVAGAQAVEGRAGALRRVDEGARRAVPAVPRDLREGTRGPRGGGEGGEEVRGVPVRQRQPRDGRDARAGGGAFASPRGRLPTPPPPPPPPPPRSPPPRPPPPRRAPSAPASPTAARARPSASAARASSGAPTRRARTPSTRAIAGSRRGTARGGCCASGVTLARWVPDGARVPFTCVRASRFPLLTASASAYFSLFVAAAARGHRVRQVRPGRVVLVAPLPGGPRPHLVRQLLQKGGACAHPD